WIGKKANKTSYGFNLLYRASRDGNTSLAFHQKCDNKGANIVVVKIKGTEQIVGGFNPFGWEGNGHKTTKDKEAIYITIKLKADGYCARIPSGMKNKKP
ncbi:17175_t:CDS:2, partial [Funneliformis geosporum]